MDLKKEREDRKKFEMRRQLKAADKLETLRQKQDQPGKHEEVLKSGCIITNFFQNFLLTN